MINIATINYCGCDCGYDPGCRGGGCCCCCSFYLYLHIIFMFIANWKLCIQRHLHDLLRHDHRSYILTAVPTCAAHRMLSTKLFAARMPLNTNGGVGFIEMNGKGGTSSKYVVPGSLGMWARLSLQRNMASRRLWREVLRGSFFFRGKAVLSMGIVALVLTANVI